MKTTKLVEVFIKLFGLYFLILSIIEGFRYVLYFRMDEYIPIKDLFTVGLYIFICIFCYWLLAAYASGIASRLKIKEDSTVNFGPASIQHVIEVSVIVLGLYVLISTLPSFVHNTYLNFKLNAMTRGGENFESFLSRFRIDYKQWLSQGISVLMAVFFTVKGKKISQWICRSNQDKALDDLD